MHMAPNRDGFYDGLCYLTTEELEQVLEDPAGFTRNERAELFRAGRVEHQTAAEARDALAAAEIREAS